MLGFLIAGLVLAVVIYFVGYRRTVKRISQFIVQYEIPWLWPNGKRLIKFMTYIYALGWPLVPVKTLTLLIDKRIDGFDQTVEAIDRFMA